MLSCAARAGNGVYLRWSSGFALSRVIRMAIYNCKAFSTVSDTAGKKFHCSSRRGLSVTRVLKLKVAMARARRVWVHGRPSQLQTS